MPNPTEQSFDLFQVQDGVVNLAQTLQIELFQNRENTGQIKQFKSKSTSNDSNNFMEELEIHGQQQQAEIIAKKGSNQINTWIFIQSYNPQLKSVVMEYSQSQSEAICPPKDSQANGEIGLDCKQNTTQPTSNYKVEKNDSKNVPKGMMKAFAHMIFDKKPQNLKVLLRFFQGSEITLKQYKQFALKIRKSPKISIKSIKQMLWTSQYAQITRKLGFHFIRKRFMHHIFYSKVEKRHIHLKYIQRWRQIFESPDQFRSLK